MENFKSVAAIRAGNYGYATTPDNTLVVGYANKMIAASKRAEKESGRERAETFTPIQRGQLYILPDGSEEVAEDFGVVRTLDGGTCPIAVGLGRGRKAADPVEILESW